MNPPVAKRPAGREVRYGVYVAVLTPEYVYLYKEGKPHALGVWQPLGGYVKYSGDGASSKLDWDVCDQLDKQIRTALKWQPSSLPSKEVCREALLVLVKARSTKED